MGIFAKCETRKHSSAVMRVFKKRKETADKKELFKYLEAELINLPPLTNEEKDEFIEDVIFFRYLYDEHVASSKYWGVEPFA